MRVHFQRSIRWVLLGLMLGIVWLAAYPLLRHQPQSQVFRRTTRVQVDNSQTAQFITETMDLAFFHGSTGTITYSQTINGATTSFSLNPQQDRYGMVFYNTLKASYDYLNLVGQPLEVGGIKSINFYRVEYAIGEEKLQFLPYPYRGVTIYTGLELGYEVCRYNQATCDPIVMTDFLTAEAEPARPKARHHKAFDQLVIKDMRDLFTKTMINAGSGSFTEDEQWLGPLPHNN